MSLEVVILAAGMGKRMHSALPKVLHTLADMPLIEHVVRTAAKLTPKAIHVVTGHGSEKVEAFLNTLPDEIKTVLKFAKQEQQLGTGHAVAQALPAIQDDSDVLVLYGDTPLTPAEVLNKLLETSQGASLAVLSAEAPNPFGYGRIVRKADGSLLKITEEKDATEEERRITEVNTGMIAAKAAVFKQYLPKISNHNAQGEYYLTDLAGMLAEENQKVAVLKADDFDTLQGVNSKPQLAFLERVFQRKQALCVMEQGATLADPDRFDLRGSLTVGKDVFIDINCIFKGKVVLGNNVKIGAGCIISDCKIGDNSEISPYSVMEKSELRVHTTIGPFARLRPGNILEDEVHVGNFVEVKNSHLQKGTKSGHLSYLGDADIGHDVNIGAGTITCNYDGANKHRTVIGNDVFVGSDTQLVAPCEVKDGVTIGAGTTVTRRTEAPENALVFTRAQTTVKDHYVRPRKEKK